MNNIRQFILIIFTGFIIHPSYSQTKTLNLKGLTSNNFQFDTTSSLVLWYTHPAALPKAWPSGYIKGLRSRGGFEINIAWKEGKLTSAVIKSIAGTRCKVRYGDKTTELNIFQGGEVKLNNELIQVD